MGSELVRGRNLTEFLSYCFKQIGSNKNPPLRTRYSALIHPPEYSECLEPGSALVGLARQSALVIHSSCELSKKKHEKFLFNVIICHAEGLWVTFCPQISLSYCTYITRSMASVKVAFSNPLPRYFITCVVNKVGARFDRKIFQSREHSKN